ncbi:MAG: T9SS type A sorting domain-containing protein [Flavobacterium sp.]|nr:MAG: T9SS type A sorting domain-containing protein [Flavobacterium sp.]
MTNYQLALKEAISNHKPLFIYFTSKNSVQSRQMEKGLLADDEVKKILNDFVRYTANVDNPVIEKFQIDKFKADVQPYFVVVVNGNNVAEFIFKMINLETNGHGNILLKIRSKESLDAGATVTKKANIFFDYNFPILTNDANTTFQDLAVEEHLMDHSIAVYPNPSQNVVNIEASSIIHSVQVYDIQGRLLLTHLANDLKTRIDISDKTDGIYFFKIYSDKGIKVERIIKK